MTVQKKIGLLIIGSLLQLAYLACSSGTDESNLAGDPRTTPKFVYIANEGSVLAYGIDVSNSRQPLNLVPIAGSPFQAGPKANGAAVDPSGSFLYVAAETGIFAFSINGKSGALTPIPGSPFNNGSLVPFGALKAHPNGRFLFAANLSAEGVSAFRIAQNGALVPTAGSPFATGGKPIAFALDASAQFLYVVKQQDHNVSFFLIDQVLGDLTAGPVFVSPQPLVDIVASPTAPYVYGTDGNGTLLVLALDLPEGRLRQLDSLGQFALGSRIAIAPSGNVLYVGGEAGIHFAALNRSTGALGVMRVAPISTRISEGRAIAVDPSGRFLYFTTDEGLFAAEIATDGSLDVKRLNIGSNPYGIAIATQQF